MRIDKDLDARAAEAGKAIGPGHAASRLADAAAGIVFPARMAEKGKCTAPEHQRRLAACIARVILAGIYTAEAMDLRALVEGELGLILEQEERFAITLLQRGRKT